MAQDLRIYIETDAGVGVSGWTVTRRAARKTGAPGAVQDTTTTDVNGMAEFLGVDSTTGPWDIYATNGTAVREWRGYASPPISTTSLTVATNALVNGSFDVWQRGTSFAAIASGAYTADRWQWAQAGTAVVTLARDTSVPTSGTNAIRANYSLKMSIPATADAAIAAGDIYGIQQPIEGFDIRALANGFTCSFWVRAHRTGTYCVAFQNRGANRTWVAEYTVSAADTWEYKTVVVTTPPFGAGTWDFTNGAGLSVFFALAVGSSFQGTAGAWQSSGILGTSNQVNGVGATTDVFQLALVNLIPGAVAAPLQPLPIALQFERCQRYLIVLSDLTHPNSDMGQATSGTSATIVCPLPVEMGGDPTVTVTSPTNYNVLTAAGANQACTALASASAKPHLVTLTATTAAGLVAGNATRLALGGGGSIWVEWNPA